MGTQGLHALLLQPTHLWPNATNGGQSIGGRERRDLRSDVPHDNAKLRPYSEQLESSSFTSGEVYSAQTELHRLHNSQRLD